MPSYAVKVLQISTAQVGEFVLRKTVIHPLYKSYSGEKKAFVDGKKLAKAL